jgi:hypothetical protein
VPQGFDRLLRYATALTCDRRVDPGWNLPAAARQLALGSTVDIATIPYGADTTTGMLSIDPAAVRAFTANFLSAKATGTHPRARRPARCPALTSPV